MTLAPQPLALFVRGFEALLGVPRPEEDILRGGRRMLTQLVADDGWLPDAYAAPDPDQYRQYLLYRDPPTAERPSRFSIVSFVWAPGQFTPIHDHRVWGLIGVLRGAETSQRYQLAPDGEPYPVGPPDRLGPGDVEAVSPTVGDIHQVANAEPDQVSVSIHVYGADIGSVVRSSYPPAGERHDFISGYSNGPATPAFTLQSEPVT